MQASTLQTVSRKLGPMLSGIQANACRGFGGQETVKSAENVPVLALVSLVISRKTVRTFPQQQGQGELGDWGPCRACGGKKVKAAGGCGLEGKQVQEAAGTAVRSRGSPGLPAHVLTHRPSLQGLCLLDWLVCLRFIF